MLEERISKLTAVVLRISASLDLETVLREIVQGARALNGARYGPITTVDDAGQPQDFVTVCPTADELMNGRVARRAAAVRPLLPGPSEPLRVADLPAYVRELGFSTDVFLSRTLQHAPATAACTSAASSSARRRADRTSRPPTRATAARSRPARSLR